MPKIAHKTLIVEAINIGSYDTKDSGSKLINASVWQRLGARFFDIITYFLLLLVLFGSVSLYFGKLIFPSDYDNSVAYRKELSAFINKVLTTNESADAIKPFK